MWYVLKFEYGHKLGDCLTFCEKDLECPDLKANGTIHQDVNLGNYMNFQVMSMLSSYSEYFLFVFEVQLAWLLGFRWYARWPTSKIK